MSGFDLFRTQRRGWIPRSTAGALRGVGEGLLPPESFIVASGSTKPLDEQPFDLEGVERELARTRRTAETSMLLRDIFSVMARDEDPEAALFGAEGLNALEGRHLEEVRALKQKPPGRRRERRLAREYYSLALLHQGDRAVRAFYLREAFGCLQRARERGRVPRADLELTCSILLALDLPGQAAARLAHVRDQADPLVLLLGARVAFQQRDFTRVASLCARLQDKADTLSPAERDAVVYWARPRG